MFTEQEIKDLELTEGQVKAINKNYKEKETELTGLANKNSDNILNNVAAIVAEKTGVTRIDKEKVSVYLPRASEEFISNEVKSKSKTKVEEAERLAGEWEDKFKNHKGDQTLKDELKIAQEKIAEFPGLLEAKDTEWGGKLETLQTDFDGYKLELGIKNSIPQLDTSINKYEADTKTANAIGRLKDTYELSYDDKGNLIGTKDYQKSLVSELLKSDTELKDILFKDDGSGGEGGGAGGGAGNGAEGGSGDIVINPALSKSAKQELIRAAIIETKKIEPWEDAFTSVFKEECKKHDAL